MPTNQDIYRTSYNAGANIEFAVNKLAVFGIDLNYANLTSKQYRPSILRAWMGEIIAYNYGNFRTMGAMAFFKIQNHEVINKPVQFFAKVGIGASVVSKTGMSYSTYYETTYLPDETSTGILFAPSLGINIPIKAKNKIVIEAQYRINKSDSQDVKSFLLNFGYGFRL